MHPTELATPLRRDARAGRRRRTPARGVTGLVTLGPVGSPSRRAATNGALLAGAALLAASGLIHLYLWADGYRHIATIGGLFLAQGVAALVLALVLVAYPRIAVAAAGMTFLLATIAAFALSAAAGLFGFQDQLDAPWAVNALLVEVAGFVLLTLGAVLPLEARRRS